MVLRTFSCWVSFCYLSLSVYGCHTSIDPPAFSPTWCSHAGDRSQRPGSDFDDAGGACRMWWWRWWRDVKMTALRELLGWNMNSQLANSTQSGWWFQPLWKIWTSVGIILPNILEKSSKCSKPPTSNSTCFAGNPYGPWRSHFREKVETFQMFHHQVGLLEMTENPALSLHQKVFLLDWNILLQTREISDMGVSINGAPKWLVHNGKSIYKWMI